MCLCLFFCTFVSCSGLAKFKVCFSVNGRIFFFYMNPEVSKTCLKFLRQIILRPQLLCYAYNRQLCLCFFFIVFNISFDIYFFKTLTSKKRDWWVNWKLSFEFLEKHYLRRYSHCYAHGSTIQSSQDLEIIWVPNKWVDKEIEIWRSSNTWEWTIC